MTLHIAPNVNHGITHEAPDDVSQEDWHESCVGDTGTSHHLTGRLYIVECEWCREAFAAKTKAEALAMFREHESAMLGIAPDVEIRRHDA